MMKKSFFFLALALSGLVHAQTAPSMTPTEAKAAWESLTPAQQAAFKQKAMNEAQAKQEAWNSLSPEEQAAKKSAAQEKAQPYAEQAKAGMTARRMERAVSGGMRRR